MVASKDSTAQNTSPSSQEGEPKTQVPSAAGKKFSNAKPAKVVQPASETTERIDRTWLQGKSSNELVSLLGEVSIALKGRLSAETIQIESNALPLSFPDVGVASYTRLPLETGKPSEEMAKCTWRVILASPDPGSDAIGLEIVDDVILGRRWDDQAPDLDLTELDGARLGVSRQHAMLRPAEDALILTDLGSTNGTFYDGKRVKLGSPQKIQDESVITLGKLHLKVQIVNSPTGTTRQFKPRF